MVLSQCKEGKGEVDGCLFCFLAGEGRRENKEDQRLDKFHGEMELGLSVMREPFKFHRHLTSGRKQS